MGNLHTPVMLTEAVDSLACRPGSTIVDCTLGGGGHAAAICRKIFPDGRLIGIDQDADALEVARQALSPWAYMLHLFHDNFANLPNILSGLGIRVVDGILVDLGISLNQIEASGRGFSFRSDEPLDMRMDPGQALTAARIVNTEDEAGLKHIFIAFGEERWAKRIARAIVNQRHRQPIRTSGQLAGIVTAAVPAKFRHAQAIHPATRVFMALRIAVNRELDMLERFLDLVLDCLRPGGRLCILAFHSLEDRMVKHRFKHWATGCTCPPQMVHCVCGKKPQVKIITRRVRRPSEAEINANPMARSTRMRVVERI